MNRAVSLPIALALTTLLACSQLACGGGGPIEKATQVSVGSQLACALEESGAVKCWGRNKWGMMRVPKDANFVQVVVGEVHGCALAKTGEVQCWGMGSKEGRIQNPDSDIDQGVPPEGITFTRIAAGAHHTCGVTEGRAIVCWGQGSSRFGSQFGNSGDRDHGQARAPDGNDFVNLSAGGYTSCGLRENGSLTCWGLGSDPNRTEDSERWDADQAVPPTGDNFAVVRNSVLHGCALTKMGKVTCWGRGHDPDAEEGFADVGQADPPDINAMALTTSTNFSCAITTAGELACWGANPAGLQENIPSGDDFVDVSGGGGTACAVRESGEVVCWGDDSHGKASPRHR